MHLMSEASNPFSFSTFAPTIFPFRRMNGNVGVGSGTSARQLQCGDVQVGLAELRDEDIKGKSISVEVR